MTTTLLTIPAGIFILLWGLVWHPQPKKKKQDEAEPELLLAEDVSAFEDVSVSDDNELTKRQLRGYLMRVMIRIIMITTGVLGVFINLIEGPDSVENLEGFALLLAIYTGLILTVQRAVKDRRVLTLLLMGLIGFMTWRTAELRDYIGENNFAVLGAAFLNLLFWLGFGRHYPPRDDTIEVEGL